MFISRYKILKNVEFIAVLHQSELAETGRGEENKFLLNHSHSLTGIFKGAPDLSGKSCFLAAENSLVTA